MRVAKTGHQRCAHPVDDCLPACALAVRQARCALRHLPDPIALDDDLAAVGIVAGAVDNAHVGENDAVRSADPVVRHRDFSSRIGSPLSDAAISSGRERPDMVGRQPCALLRLFERRPMAAARQNPDLSALDRVRKGLHGRRGSDRIVLAGHEKRRGAQAAEVDRLRRRPAPRRIGRSPLRPGANGFPGHRRGRWD